MPSSRRSTAVLACVLLVLAGCAGTPTDSASTSTSPTAPTNDTPADATTATTSATATERTTSPPTTDSTHDRWIRGDVVPVRPYQIATETSTRIQRLDASAASIARQAVTNGSVTVTSVREPYSGGPYPVVVNESVYDINRTVISSETVTVHEIEMEGPLREGSDQYQTAESDAIAFDDLPAADQQAFLAGIPENENLSRISFSTQFPYHYENGTPPADSVFVSDEPRYVAYQGHYFQIGSDGTDEREQRTYRYEATRVAPNMTAYEDVAVERYVTNVSNTSLPTGVEEILLGGIENGSVYYHSEDPSIDSDYRAFYQWSRENRFVEYEGEYYWLRIMKVME